MGTTRRTVSAGLPLAGIPDFSAPLATKGVLRAEQPPDVDLIALCREHERQWQAACEWDATEEASNAATEEMLRLAGIIAGITPKTAIGLACKARCVAIEHGFGFRLAGRDPYPLRNDDVILFAFLADLIEMRSPVAA